MTTETKTSYYDLPAEHQRSVRDFAARFHNIPGVIFEKLRDCYADGLELVGSPHQACPECWETNTEAVPEPHTPGGLRVDAALYANPEAMALLDDENDLEPLDDPWKCNACGHIDEAAEFTPAPSEYAYPCGWGMLFHDESGFLRGREHLAVEAGFLVFKHPDFNNVLLGVDGGGYDFYAAHWWPLYTLLDLKWHEKRGT